ncbi:inactive serine/threonine-protein kinase TEX14-like [Conger conger]|uniref:inactive serine/threonine-protein kinase TEX14-like n=1 Tax=Conger conger TaxID=82655 RepID=UPI002A59BDC5|nr:inactive serine/threonine-protein kinase TEX14-like [Conger conger]
MLGPNSERKKEEDQKRIPCQDDQAIMEDTLRAHSTLDEDLLEMAAGQRFMEIPGAIEPSRAQDGLRTETTHLAGDTVEAVIAERKEDSSSKNSLEHQEEKVEAVNHESWSQPHRVIVLEQTPHKRVNPSESDQVLDK